MKQRNGNHFLGKIKLLGNWKIDLRKNTSFISFFLGAEQKVLSYIQNSFIYPTDVVLQETAESVLNYEEQVLNHNFS